MKLSDLKTGEKGVIVKVLGHGGFRKRIVEMGFIKGQIVEVLLHAPLRDPVKYKIMGYEVSLRHNEAAMIEIMSVEEARSIDKEKHTAGNNNDEEAVIDNNFNKEDEQEEPLEKKLHEAALKKRKKINVALVGNPNCGKTSLFNYISGAHERVGNYSGVTVDAKEGHANFEGYEYYRSARHLFPLGIQSRGTVRQKRDYRQDSRYHHQCHRLKQYGKKPLSYHPACGHEPENHLCPEHV